MIQAAPMTRQAVEEQVDLVIGAGWDGTIRYVADGRPTPGFRWGWYRAQATCWLGTLIFHLLPVRLTVQLDNSRPVRRHAMLCVIGNVGTL
jgi:hypothetical protein